MSKREKILNTIVTLICLVAGLTLTVLGVIYLAREGKHLSHFVIMSALMLISGLPLVVIGTLKGSKWIKELKKRNVKITHVHAN